MGLIISNLTAVPRNLIAKLLFISSIEIFVKLYYTKELQLVLITRKLVQLLSPTQTHLKERVS